MNNREYNKQYNLTYGKRLSMLKPMIELQVCK